MNSPLLKLKNFYYRFRPLENYYGSEFKRIYNFLLESRRWSAEQIRDYKFKKLIALLEHAEKNVPYYRELFAREGISSRDIKSYRDFARIPILTKQAVRTNQEKLKADNFKSYRPLRTETSGTTGHVTMVYRSKYHENFRRAVLARFYREFGYKFREPRININFPHSVQKDSPVYFYDKLLNTYSINISHIMAGRYQMVYEAVSALPAKLIWAHPNILFNLAQYMVDNGLDPIEAPYVVTYAETIYPQTRKIMNQAFPGQYYEYYGNRENSIGAWGFSNGSFFEISEYCHLEINKSNSIESHPEAGDIISTSLNNYAFPLIRYDCGDVGQIEGYPNTEIPYPSIKLIGGRGKDILLTREGLFIPYFLSHLEQNNFDKIKYTQLVQLSLDELVVNYIPRDNFDESRDAEIFARLIEEALVHKFKIRLERVDEVNFTRSGKSPSSISRLADEYIARLGTTA